MHEFFVQGWQTTAATAAMLAAVLAGLAGCSPQPASTSGAASGASAASEAASAASSASFGPQRSAFKARFVQLFEQDCLPRVTDNAGLSQPQTIYFCQCYAAALADNNSEEQLTRYLGGHDQEKVVADANLYGKACLEQARQKQ